MFRALAVGGVVGEPVVYCDAVVEEVRGGGRAHPCCRRASRVGAIVIDALTDVFSPDHSSRSFGRALPPTRPSAECPAPAQILRPAATDVAIPCRWRSTRNTSGRGTGWASARPVLRARLGLPFGAVSRLLCPQRSRSSGIGSRADERHTTSAGSIAVSCLRRGMSSKAASALPSASERAAGSIAKRVSTARAAPVDWCASSGEPLYAGVGVIGGRPTRPGGGRRRCRTSRRGMTGTPTTVRSRSGRRPAHRGTRLDSVRIGGATGVPKIRAWFLQAAAREEASGLRVRKRPRGSSGSNEASLPSGR